jgi:hypothetical protein
MAKPRGNGTAHAQHAVRLGRESLRLGYEGGLPATASADLVRFMALAQTSDRAERHEAWRQRK